MNSLVGTFKKFFGNKNTVSILGVVAGILVLYIGYNWRINQSISPIVVPYAKVELNERTQVTEKEIGYVKVSSNVIDSSPNVIKDSSLVVNNYVAMGTKIPAGSLFYESAIVEKKELPDSAFADIKDGYTIYSLNVNIHTTYGNQIYPGNYIDLYMKATDENGKIIFGKLIESIKVLAVKDSEGHHLFEETVETRTPSELLFAVPEDMYLLLMKAGYIGNDIEIVPVPRNTSYSAKPGETSVASDYMKNYILSKTAIIPEDTVVEETNE